MFLEISFLLLTIFWIIIGCSLFKWHPFYVLLAGCVFLSFTIKIDPRDVPFEIIKGFIKTIRSIGLLILFGAIIGIALEKSHATKVIAVSILKYFIKIPITYTISLIGFIVSIPVFCDAAFVILSTLNKKLSEITSRSKTSLTVALSTGLFAPHVLVPPTPGPIAAASILNLENILYLFLFGGILALILALTGALFSEYFIEKVKFSSNNMLNLKDLKKISVADHNTLDFKMASSPIWVPIVLMALGPLVKDFNDYLNLISNPTFALFIGAIISLWISFKKNSLMDIFFPSIKLSIPIIGITGMGGALGSIIQNINIASWFNEISSISTMGIIIPFIIAATLKTAQGSSTVAIITASSIVAPILYVFGLDNEMGKVLAILSIGVGSMTVSHSNDSYFWIVSQLGGIDIKTAYRTHTLATFIQGITGIFLIGIFFSIISFFSF
ncbi:MAG: permease [Flavobacteriaceae bacterium]|nr:permease [Flavobacteriaceae bacterium]|tara:strand:- start:26462 stop:27787 length:1326 start_codon:yes stop_codon:yes gene_type:complete